MNQLQFSNSENLQSPSTSSNMNQSQVPNLVNLQSSFSTIYSNSQDSNVLPRQDANSCHVTTAVYPPYDNTQTQILQSTLATIVLHPSTFFYKPPNDFYNYHVNCEVICH